MFPPQRINLTNWKKQLDRKSNPETFFFESGRLKKPDIRYTKYFFPQAAQIASRATIYFFLRIDSNVEDTQLNVEAAHSEILKYFQSVSSNRWLMIKIFLVLVVFFIIFVVFFAWARKNRKHGGEKKQTFCEKRTFKLRLGNPMEGMQTFNCMEDYRDLFPQGSTEEVILQSHCFVASELKVVLNSTLTNDSLFMAII